MHDVDEVHQTSSCDSPVRSAPVGVIKHAPGTVAAAKVASMSLVVINDWLPAGNEVDII